MNIEAVHIITSISPNLSLTFYFKSYHTLCIIIPVLRKFLRDDQKGEFYLFMFILLLHNLVFSDPHSASLLRYTCGIVNPGYIPDQPGKDEEQGEKGSKSTQHMSDERPALSRPGSREKTLLDGTLSGPRQHYRAQETYFDCEFYIYGHKYQSEWQQVNNDVIII